jgi:hypothetical protein
VDVTTQRHHAETITQPKIGEAASGVVLAFLTQCQLASCRGLDILIHAEKIIGIKFLLYSSQAL